jgi:hypothetical protein
VGIPGGKKPRIRWDDCIKMDFKEIWTEGVDQIHLAQERNH